LNRLFNDSAEITFSGRRSAENELTRIKGSLNRGYHDIAY